MAREEFCKIRKRIFEDTNDEYVDWIPVVSGKFRNHKDMDVQIVHKDQSRDYAKIDSDGKILFELKAGDRVSYYIPCEKTL